MLEGILVTVVGALAIAVLAFCGRWTRRLYDQCQIRRWLFANTRDEPGESHVSTSAIAAGVRLPEGRVDHACMSSRRILRSEQGLWSIWRQEPQSVYDKRGIRIV